MKESWRSMSDLKRLQRRLAGGLVGKAATTNQGSLGGRLTMRGDTPDASQVHSSRQVFSLTDSTTKIPTLLYVYYSFHGFTDLKGSFLTAGLVAIS